ncbi:hypothetical protein Rhopal_004423-T1 [Rhodotorula paludigena]|uniref:Piwi-domain-containing protein n=1 Tax=Rhodotorula paludigena TaxID=86838 RepID=A0AAV5GQV4_9BASI|nr:hypothetical protein Rhopal_004423-T1 [Rhodotorula paludigena]
MASTLATQVGRLAIGGPAPPQSSLLVPMRRPGVGTSGQVISVRVNAFPVNAPDKTIYHYDVKISPTDADRPKRLNRRIWQYFASSQAPFGRVAVAYDGKAMAYSPVRLPADEGSWSFDLPEEDGSAARRGNHFTVQLKLIGPINLGALRAFVGGRATSDTVMECLQALNVVLQHGPMMVNPSRGASFFLRGDNPEQARGFELWRGYYSSLRPGIGGGYINLDLASAPFHKPGSLPDVLVDLAQVELGRVTHGNLASIPPVALIKLSRMVKGLHITLTVRDRDGKPVKRRIRSITSESARDYHFQTETGTTNVANYFRSAYGVNLRHPEWPCVLVTRTARWPIELCQADVGQKYTMELSPSQVSEVIRFTTIKPRERLAKLQAGLRAIAPNQNNPALKQWELQVATEPLRVQARVLPPPQVTAANAIRPQAGVFQMRGKFLQPASLDNWQQLTQAGVRIGPTAPPIHYAVNVRPDDAPNFIRSKVVPAGAKAPASPPQLIVCFLAEKPSPFYGKIKFLGDVQTGTPTQCLNITKARRNDRNYFANVALKINARLGGTNWTASLGPILKKPTMIFGIDVTHPKPGLDGPSVAAVVGSLNKEITRYGTRMATQQGRQEIIANLAEMVQSLLEQFRKEVRIQPEQLIFFRDGVSEGEYARVLTGEVNAVRLACQRIDVNFKPKITFIVCGKKHHISIFPDRPQDSDGKTGNVPAGTTIDTVITSPFQFDWYTQAHTSLLGTSRSAHFTVLTDDSHFSADDLQALCYNICYTFARCTRSVSLATPAYYADLVCTRAALYLATTNSTRVGSTVHAGHGNKLFFI